MKKYIEYFKNEHLELLRNQLLFSGLTDHEIFMFIQFSSPFYIKLKEGQSVRIANEYSHMISVVFSGTTYINKVDHDGNKTILKSVEENENSGTLYAVFDYFNSLIELNAKEDSEILLIKPDALFITDKHFSDIQHKIVVNMIASQRIAFLELSEHLSCLSRRSIREKVLGFLKNYYYTLQTDSFEVPYSREELANYLAVDRASLSRTLGELKADGIIDFRKNKFTILTDSEF